MRFRGIFPSNQISPLEGFVRKALKTPKMGQKKASKDLPQKLGYLIAAFNSRKEKEAKVALTGTIGSPGGQVGAQW